jgi:hypothetical protein
MNQPCHKLASAAASATFTGMGFRLTKVSMPAASRTRRRRSLLPRKPHASRFRPGMTYPSRFLAPHVLGNVPETTPEAGKCTPGRPFWPSRDPIGERGGMNLYGFCNNNTIFNYDYLGTENRVAQMALTSKLVALTLDTQNNGKSFRFPDNGDIKSSKLYHKEKDRFYDDQAIMLGKIYDKRLSPGQADEYHHYSNEPSIDYNVGHLLMLTLGGSEKITVRGKVIAKKDHNCKLLMYFNDEWTWHDHNNFHPDKITYIGIEIPLDAAFSPGQQSGEITLFEFLIYWHERAKKTYNTITNKLE